MDLALEFQDNMYFDAMYQAVSPDYLALDRSNIYRQFIRSATPPAALRGQTIKNGHERADRVPLAIGGDAACRIWCAWGCSAACEVASRGHGECWKHSCPPGRHQEEMGAGGGERRFRAAIQILAARGVGDQI